MRQRIPFVVLGEFQYGKKLVREVWRGPASSGVVALREAVGELWERPTVRWKHIDHAVFRLTNQGRQKRTIVRKF